MAAGCGLSSPRRACHAVGRRGRVALELPGPQIWTQGANSRASRIARPEAPPDPSMTDSTTAPVAAPSHEGAVRVVPYSSARPDHRSAFRDLNLAWIERHFAVEPRDRRELDDPEGQILAHGGQIFVAETDDRGGPEVLGVCALLVEHDGACELAKMAVRETARGRGVGRALGEAVIAAARGRGAPRVELLSNRALAPAIALYRALGFVEAPLPATEYARADIRMVLDLSRERAGE